MRQCIHDNILIVLPRVPTMPHRNLACARKDTLLHGDAHIGNTYVLPDGDVGFLDWQVLRRGEWSQDVGYFLISALTQEDRRKNEADLLEEYRKTLRLPQQRQLSTDEVWARYRATPIYGLAIWLSTLGTDGWQSKEISLTLSQRFSSAFAGPDSGRS